MMGIARKILPLLTALLIFLPGAAPEARAMDPVTIAILAPLAVKAAQIAAPYVVRGFLCGCRQICKMCVDIFKVLNLPLGLVQMTIGIPFGQFDKGKQNCWYGLMSPFKFVWDTLVLPIAFTGVDPPG